METFNILFYVLLFLIAFLYSSVGHGGASGYLALMSFFSVSPALSRQSALVLNIFVSFIAFYQYYKSNNFNFKLFFPFAISSIPAAFAGGLIDLEHGIYKKLLAVLLVIPAIKLFSEQQSAESKIKKQNILLSIVIGMAIGFVSGVIGIGGGIILSPVILLLGWGNIKQAAAVSALFIFVNSISGMAGVISKGFNFEKEIFILVIIAIAGGLAGSYLGARKFNNKTLKSVLALVLLIASVKLFFT